jgi:hypothetical protein
MANKRRRLGREAIELLKNAYRDGQEFSDIYAIRDYLIAELGVKPAWVPWGSVGNFDRQARLENADDNYANTSPSRLNGYRRNPNADPAERKTAHGPALRGLATRGANELRIAKGNAAQPDATRVEVQREARLEIVAPMLQLLAELNS